MKHLINLGGWITVGSPLYTHTDTQKLATSPIPNPCNAETQNEFYGKGSLIPRDALACGAFFFFFFFFKASLRVMYHCMGQFMSAKAISVCMNISQDSMKQLRS